MEEYLSILWMEGGGTTSSSNGYPNYNYNDYDYSVSGGGGSNDNMGINMIVSSGDILVDSTTTITTTTSRLLQSRTVSNLSSGIQMIICLSMYGTFL